MAGATAGAGALVLASCTQASEGRSGDDDLPAITIGLTYVPNVQFAAFYRALEAGYFTDAGVDVTLRHHGEGEDLFSALQAGEQQVVTVGGDEVVQARSAGVDVVSIATIYREYPVVLIVPEDSAIQGTGDLPGARIGVPGKFGQTWFGLLAMLQQAGLSEDDVTITEIGFTQQQALSGGHVDAVMGFVNNDVPQFRATGLAVRAVDPGTLPLIGIGLGVPSEVLDEHADALVGVTTGLARAVREIAADPEVAVTATVAQIPGTVDADQAAIMLDVAELTVPLYGDLDRTWGEHDPARWEQMAQEMHDLGLVEELVRVEDAFTNDALPASD